VSVDAGVNSTPDRSVLAPDPAGVEPEPSSRWLRGHVPGEAGIWIFIFGDMCLYGALFVSFMHDRAKHPDRFNQSAGTLHTSFGAINTVLLLTSSLCVALGVRAVREQIAVKRAPILFRLAFVCGAAFVFNKYLEYSDLISSHHTPGRNTFYTYYFVLTGIHLTHLVAGMCVLVFLRRMSLKDAWQANDIRAIESGASFWHVVDLLWIVLFALLYLVR
jgi:nitric oxide reductase NorE protein